MTEHDVDDGHCSCGATHDLFADQAYLERIRTLEGKTHPGPWIDEYSYRMRFPDGMLIAEFKHVEDWPVKPSGADVAFLAQSRETVPWLLNLVDRTQSYVRALRAEIQALRAGDH